MRRIERLELAARIDRLLQGLSDEQLPTEVRAVVADTQRLVDVELGKG